MPDINYDVLIKGGMALFTLAIYAMVLVVLTRFIMSYVYAGLKSLFGKNQNAAEAEPGQLPKKARKEQRVPGFKAADAADEYAARDAAEMEQEAAPSSPAVPATALAAHAKPAVEHAPGVSFADRLADEFGAREVSA